WGIATRIKNLPKWIPKTYRMFVLSLMNLLGTFYSQLKKLGKDTIHFYPELKSIRQISQHVECWGKNPIISEMIRMRNFPFIYKSIIVLLFVSIIFKMIH